MQAEEIKQRLLQSIPNAQIQITGEGENYSVEIVSDSFANTSKLNRQKMVLSCVKDEIAAGEIHAFSVQTYTQEEWKTNIGSSLAVL